MKEKTDPSDKHNDIRYYEVNEFMILNLELIMQEKIRLETPQEL